MKLKKLLVLVMAAVMLLACALPAYAAATETEIETGKFVVTVKDTKGNPVSKAWVDFMTGEGGEAVGVEKGKTGVYTVSDVPFGTEGPLVVSAEGYEYYETTYIFKGIDPETVVVAAAHKITVDDDGHGVGTPDLYWSAPGRELSVLVSPNEGYTFDRFETKDVVLTGDTFTMPNKNVTIKVFFKPVTGGLYTGTERKPVSDGTWKYDSSKDSWTYATSQPFKNTWGCIVTPEYGSKPAWYYFDKDGKMLTGWQKLYRNDAFSWFYFSEKKDATYGACQLGGVTPDGYALNPDGSLKEN